MTENLILADSDNEDVKKTIVDCRSAIKQCADVLYPLTKGEKIDSSAAYSAAARAAYSADSAAYSAAYSAAARAAYSADSAAYSAAARAAYSAAARAAYSADSADSAADSADSAAASAASAAYSAAYSAAWVKMADKLVQLLQEAGE